MKELAIRVENLGKKYFISKSSDTITGSFNRIFSKQDKETFWALKDVSFEVQRGESIGIIGRNGAGKSTLLKILSRITPPTAGVAMIKGKVASLLEVGTGFHPELTGRENIFLNGALLGMSRVEIKSKMEEIIDFSGIEKFIDTPVKKYSSGMYVRLAFSVAAHLDSDVLIVDEVLSVGDHEFQKKCLSAMSKISSTGKILLFVSHNLGVVRSICKKSILLEKGLLLKSGETDEMVAHYLESDEKNAVKLSTGALTEVSFIQNKKTLRFKISYMCKNIVFPNIDLVISDNFGNNLFGINTRYSVPILEGHFPDSGSIIFNFNYPKLRSGFYNLSVWFGKSRTKYEEDHQNLLTFYVENLEELAGKLDENYYGKVIPSFSWKIE